MERDVLSRGCRDLRRVLTRVLMLVACVAAVGCTKRPPDARPIAAPVRDELDPLGFVLEQGPALRLTAAQAADIRALRVRLRAANRADYASLDSLDFALGGRLRNWLTEAQGGPRPRRRWLPTLAAAERETFERLVGRVRARGEAAECRMAVLLTAEQRTKLVKLDSLEHRRPTRRQTEGKLPGLHAADADERHVLGEWGETSCTDPLPSLRS